MSHRNTLRSVRLGLSAAAITALVPLSAVADHSWGSYHWARTSNPFTVRLGDNVSSTWDSYLATTSSDWSVSSVLNTTVVAGSTTGQACRATTGRVQVCNYTYGSTGWLGVASISTSGNHIVSATVKVNDTYFNTSTYNTSAWRNLVMCQEVGHTFGLDHQDENFSNANLGTCMDYTNSPGSNQHPNAHDYGELQSIYAHTDSSSTVSTVAASAAGLPPAMTQLRLDGPGQWGRVAERYEDGRPKLYELDFGGGKKILTHVFWAPDFNVDESAE